MNKCLYASKVLLTGLVTGQVLATIHVYLSNVKLYHTLSALGDAGYLTIPNQRVMEHLTEPAPALLGGLFFTLSVGAALTLLTLATVWVWDRLLFRKKFLLPVFLIPWLGLLFELNRRSFSPMATSYFLLIPPVVFAVGLKWLPAKETRTVWLRRFVHSVPIMILAFLWATQMDGRLFAGLRDNLLLSNSFGIRVNDFYYKYTLYPAEAFKSLDQKTLKTCAFENVEKKPAGLLEKKLCNYDYLNLAGSPAVDLRMVKQDHLLLFQHQGQAIIETSLPDFLSKPATVLEKFSSLTDRYGFFRRFTFFSLLIGFPVTLYVFFHAVLCLGLSLFLRSKVSSAIASAICLISGIALLSLFYLGMAERIKTEALPGAMESARWQTRVTALKTICGKRMEIADFEPYQAMISSPHIPERYWLARALGVSQRPVTYNDLLLMLGDLHPNVVCMAFHSLGQRGHRSAIPQILDRIRASDHWYEQCYAYRALRRLGWKQAISE